MFFEAERPTRVLTAIGAMRRHVDELTALDDVDRDG
jgi:hypothetical protein